MVTLVVYDISKNRERLIVDHLCRDYGLQRVQDSVFRGAIDAKKRKKLVKSIESESHQDHEDTWDVQIYFISDDDFKTHHCFGPEGARPDPEETEDVVFI